MNHRLYIDGFRMKSLNLVFRAFDVELLALLFRKLWGSSRKHLRCCNAVKLRYRVYLVFHNAASENLQGDPKRNKTFLGFVPFWVPL